VIAIAVGRRVAGFEADYATATDAAQVDLRNLLDHCKTKDLVALYKREISASKSLRKVLHMGETGSVACHGKKGVSDPLGAALWELDYALNGESSGILRFFFHMGQGDFYYSMWEPQGTTRNPTAHINAP